MRRTAFLTLTLSLTLALPLVAAEPFNGKNFEGWSFKGDKSKSKWVVGAARLDDKDPGKLEVADAKAGEPAAMIDVEKSVDIYTNEKYGDHTISLEVMVPKGSNSGVYVQGEYEVQILDSYGKEKVGPGDIGGLYGSAAPRKNAAKAPGEWQTLEIVFQAPKFEGDKKVANAKFVKVVLNGETIHENVEMKGPTPSGLTGKEAATGPVMFQGDHGPVAYRKIKITK